MQYYDIKNFTEAQKKALHKKISDGASLGGGTGFANALLGKDRVLIIIGHTILELEEADLLKLSTLLA